MSRFFTGTLSALTPYTPGEQPQDKGYIKLNTNESPFAPSENAKRIAAGFLRDLNLYPDPACSLVIKRLSELYAVPEDCIILGNGSDELLFMSFRAFCDETHCALFPDITYGFYPVFAAVNRVPYTEIPLTEDFSLDLSDYDCGAETFAAKGCVCPAGAVYIANPNAPTGKALDPSLIAEFAASHPDTVVVVDEAYVDFGAKSCIPLTGKYDNILVIQTFSKSRSLAGARIGFAIGDPELVRDLNTIRFSLNPYNINSMTIAAACGVLADEARVRANCAYIEDVREYTAKGLRGLGFEVADSLSNFVFARTPAMEGGQLYRRLKEKGILVRHFDKDRISDYVRITIGLREQMDALLDTLREILPH